MAVSLPVTSLYGGLFAFFYLVLVARVGMLRLEKKVSVGNGADLQLTYAIRVRDIPSSLSFLDGGSVSKGHANFQEYIPLFLILLGLLELQQLLSRAWLHGLALLCCAGRICHAYQFCWGGPTHLRRKGMILTIVSLTVEISVLFIFALMSMFH